MHFFVPEWLDIFLVLKPKTSNPHICRDVEFSYIPNQLECSLLFHLCSLHAVASTNNEIRQQMTANHDNQDSCSPSH